MKALALFGCCLQGQPNIWFQYLTRKVFSIHQVKSFTKETSLLTLYLDWCFAGDGTQGAQKFSGVTQLLSNMHFTFLHAEKG